MSPFCQLVRHGSVAATIAERLGRSLAPPFRIWSRIRRRLLAKLLAKRFGHACFSSDE
jgi:hypothetical protein